VCVLCQNGYIFSTSSGCIATTTTTTTTTIDPCVTQNYEKWSPTAIAAYQYTPSGAQCSCSHGNYCQCKTTGPATNANPGQWGCITDGCNADCSRGPGGPGPNCGNGGGC